MNNYQATIGLEIHTELKTKSKMFCGCSNDPFCKEANIHTCPVCLGLPGAIPSCNRQAIEAVIKIGQAVNGKIAETSFWERKNYFYPDLPKGFQISQYDVPLVTGGNIHGIELTRIHLEEDTGKLFHPQGADYSLVDYNRSGVPLMELVTEPVIESGEQAVAFAKEYQLILRHLDAADADMEKGQMRCEANISLRKFKITNQNLKLGTKVEIKNLNSFRSLQKAIDYEIKRQAELLENNKEVIQETRGWDENKQITFSQRTKETSADYRYFPEPDLPPIIFKRFKIKDLRFKNSQELPREKRVRYAKQFNLTENTIETLVANIERMKLFEKLAEKNPEKARKIALMIANAKSSELEKIEEKLAETRESAISAVELTEIVKNVLSENLELVGKIKTGKTQAIQALVGQVMAKTKGKARGAEIIELIKKMI